MARLSDRDRQEVDALGRELGVFREGVRALPSVLAELRALIGADRALAYRVRAAGEHFEFDFGYWSGFAVDSATLNGRVRAALATARAPWALFDPRRLEHPQRNAVVRMPAPRRLAAGIERLLPRLGARRDDRDRLIARMQRLDRGFLPQIGLNDLAVCRALVCCEERLLTWIGVAREADFGVREEMMLARLLTALQRRLRLEAQLDEAELSTATLDLMLERLGRPALVLFNRRVVHANREGCALATSPALVDALAAGAAVGWETVAITAEGMAPHTLALGPRPTSTGEVVALAAKRWRLTTRQCQVLAAVVDGAANKEIATALGVSARTVELQVTALFARAAVSSRTALVSAVWRLAL